MSEKKKSESSWSFIEYQSVRFIIHEAPSESNLSTYVKIFQENNVRLLVRAAQVTYSIAQLQEIGVAVLDLPFEDGEPPPSDVVTKWNKATRDVFAQPGKPVVAVHCSAGIGRAPVLVAVSLIEAGMESGAAVQLLRKKRPGVINTKQLDFLDTYKSSAPKPCCTIS